MTPASFPQCYASQTYAAPLPARTDAHQSGPSLTRVSAIPADFILDFTLGFASAARPKLDTMPAPRVPPFAIIARVMLLPYVVTVALIVWLPATAASKVTGIVFRLAGYVSEHSGISLTTSYTVFEFVANIALFVPLGLLLVAAWPRSNAWVVLLLGYSASATIELVQTLLPSRYPTLSDVVANTIGTAIGCLAVRLFVQRHPAPRNVRASTVGA